MNTKRGKWFGSRWRWKEFGITRRIVGVTGWQSMVLCVGLLVSGKPAAVAVELGVARQSAGDQVQITVSGGTGHWHRVETSTNLFDWGTLTSFYQSNSSSVWLDSGVTSSSQRYYRSRDLTTALDRYVAVPDTNYTYTLVGTYAGAGQTTYVLDMTSQAWLTTNEVDRTLWKHWLILVKPSIMTNSKAMLFISSGSNPGTPPPTGADSNLRQIAIDTGSVVTELKMVPNQPLTFVGETRTRTEDELIAYTWDKYLRTGDEKWPARLPMTKAAVRAMETVISFCATNGGGVNVDKFVVTGASKRGWTTWTTAAVDRRVVAIIPMVIDLLNLEPSFAHHYRAYGFWSPAIQDYVDLGIPAWFGSPEFRALMEIVEPYEYRARLTMPKFLINAADDEFFLPDSAQFYFADLLGVKYLRYMPNVGHNLGGSYSAQLKGYYQSVLFNTPLPQFSWSLTSSNSVRVVTIDLPTEAKLWQAANPSARDFRAQFTSVTWTSSALTDQGGGVYVGTVSVPPQGWKGFFVELTYARSGNLAPLIFTTQVYVVPDTLPYTYPP